MRESRITRYALHSGYTHCRYEAPKATTQSGGARVALDCFAPLAMTA
jgi:hypothetical protein